MYNIKGLKQTNLKLYNFVNNKPILSTTIKNEPFYLEYKEGDKIKYKNHSYSVTKREPHEDHSTIYYLKKED